MTKNIVYAIIKTYKGIFKKKHIGNTQLLFIPINNKFILVELLGEHMDHDNVFWSVKRLEGPVDYMYSSIMELKETMTSGSSSEFIILDELECSTKEVNQNEFKITLKSIGNYLKSKTYTLAFNRQHSKSTPLYLLDGKINVEFTDMVTPNTVNMVSMRKDAKLKSHFKMLKLKGARTL